MERGRKTLFSNVFGEYRNLQQAVETKLPQRNSMLDFWCFLENICSKKSQNWATHQFWIAFLDDFPVVSRFLVIFAGKNTLQLGYPMFFINIYCFYVKNYPRAIFDVAYTRDIQDISSFQNKWTFKLGPGISEYVVLETKCEKYYVNILTSFCSKT